VCSSGQRQEVGGVVDWAMGKEKWGEAFTKDQSRVLLEHEIDHTLLSYISLLFVVLEHVYLSLCVKSISYSVVFFLIKRIKE